MHMSTQTKRKTVHKWRAVLLLILFALFMFILAQYVVQYEATEALSDVSSLIIDEQKEQEDESLLRKAVSADDEKSKKQPMVKQIIDEQKEQEDESMLRKAVSADDEKSKKQPMVKQIIDEQKDQEDESLLRKAVSADDEKSKKQPMVKQIIDEQKDQEDELVLPKAVSARDDLTKSNSNEMIAADSIPLEQILETIETSAEITQPLPSHIEDMRPKHNKSDSADKKEDETTEQEKQLAASVLKSLYADKSGVVQQQMEHYVKHTLLTQQALSLNEELQTFLQNKTKNDEPDIITYYEFMHLLAKFKYRALYNLFATANAILPDMYYDMIASKNFENILTPLWNTYYKNISKFPTVQTADFSHIVSKTQLHLPYAFFAQSNSANVVNSYILLELRFAIEGLMNKYRIHGYKQITLDVDGFYRYTLGHKSDVIMIQWNKFTTLVNKYEYLSQIWRLIADDPTLIELHYCWYKVESMSRLVIYSLAHHLKVSTNHLFRNIFLERSVAIHEFYQLDFDATYNFLRQLPLKKIQKDDWLNIADHISARHRKYGFSLTNRAHEHLVTLKHTLADVILWNFLKQYDLMEKPSKSYRIVPKYFRLNDVFKKKGFTVEKVDQKSNIMYKGDKLDHPKQILILYIADILKQRLNHLDKLKAAKQLSVSSDKSHMIGRRQVEEPWKYSHFLHFDWYEIDSWLLKVDCKENPDILRQKASKLLFRNDLTLFRFYIYRI